MSSNSRSALIFGSSGQDGTCLTRHLTALGYRVAGTTRALDGALRCDVSDFDNVVSVVESVRPTEIYNLAGQSSVGLSFERPMETMHSISTGTLNILEAIRQSGRPTRFFNAGSAEMFGDTYGVAATERTPPNPCSPYGVAKAAAFFLVSNYREAYGMFACTGILFNHESPLRPESFVTQKVVRATCRIAAGSNERLKLGNIDVQRDWGWAADYVDPMHRMLTLDSPHDLVLATGETRPLADFIAHAFACVGLDWRRHVDVDPGLMRPTDVPVIRADPSAAAEIIGWRAGPHMDEVVSRMIEAERARLSL